MRESTIALNSDKLGRDTASDCHREKNEGSHQCSHRFDSTFQITLSLVSSRISLSSTFFSFACQRDMKLSRR